jgi:hypothetical protein
MTALMTRRITETTAESMAVVACRFEDSGGSQKPSESSVGGAWTLREIVRIEVVELYLSRSFHNEKLRSSVPQSSMPGSLMMPLFLFIRPSIARKGYLANICS